MEPTAAKKQEELVSKVRESTGRSPRAARAAVVPIRRAVAPEAKATSAGLSRPARNLQRVGELPRRSYNDYC